MLSQPFSRGLLVVDEWLHSRTCLKTITFAVNFPLWQITQTVKRKAAEREDSSPAGKTLFFSWVCLVRIQCFDKTLKVKLVTAILITEL